MKIAILLSCCFLSLAAHNLTYISTWITPEQTFTAVVELDGQKILHWDSNNMTMVPDTEWMKNVSILEKETEFMQREKGELDFLLSNIMGHFQHSEDVAFEGVVLHISSEVHSLSRIYGCQINDENKKGSGFKRFNYDQEEFLRLNLTSLTWTPANAKAQKFLNEEEWDESKNEAKRWKEIVEVDCIKSLQQYVYTMHQVPRKVNVFPLQQPALYLELEFHATGFLPEGVLMKCKKNREEVEVERMLPNQDESFQMKTSERVSPEDLQKNKYTCVIQHGSLEEDLKKESDKHQIWKSDEAFNHGVIVGVFVSLLVVVPVVVGVGILMWKKKIISVSKPVSSGPDPDKDEFIHPNDKTKKELIDEPKRLRFQDL